MQGAHKKTLIRWLVLPLICIVAAAAAGALLHKAYTGVRDGSISLRGRAGVTYVTVRSEQPTLFWFEVALHAYLGLMIVGVAAWPVVHEIRRSRANEPVSTSTVLVRLRRIYGTNAQPTHPGEVLQDTVLRTVTVTELAKCLEASRVAPLTTPPS